MNHSNNPELILIENSMDDEFLSLQAIKNSGIECNVSIRRDGAEALDHLRNELAPTPALIVLNYHLPELSGLDILAEVRRKEKTRFVPVVVLSSTSKSREMSDCFKFGANGFVVKPFDAKEYVDRLAKIVFYWLSINDAGYPAQLNETGPRMRPPSIWQMPASSVPADGSSDAGMSS